MIKIAVDAMGGDFAPRAIVEGAWRAAREDGINVVLVGDRETVELYLARLGKTPPPTLEVEHAPEVVGMDEPAITPIRKKRRSSIAIAAELVRDGKAQAMVSAGNTGAVMIAAKLVLGTIPGVDRPALAAILPNAHGRTVLLDVGANVEVKLSHLREFAVMGHFYAQEMLGTEKPRIGLLSIGEEASKGTEFTRQVFRALETTGLNFIGNVEGRDVFEGTADVVVCDGFVGNVLLKAAESVAGLLAAMLREEMEKGIVSRLGGLLARGAFRRLRQRTDYREYGGAPLLGVAGGCFIAHGRSGARAIQTAIHRALEFSSLGLHEKIAENVARLHSEEARILKAGAGGGS
ncbi:MAG TPA: phosphate acyltransferase PlsX [Thermoanaerobaculia bacterium]|nr:phosphate acyltransferase PlsX [Thermoanaerobaculia bacterium]